MGRKKMTFAWLICCVPRNIGLPTEKLKVQQFQICCTRTKYLAEIHKSQTKIVYTQSYTSVT